MKKELNIENRIEIDRSEAEKYELIHESCVFSLLIFQPNTSTDELWSVFKSKIQILTEAAVPRKSHRRKKANPWFSKRIKKEFDLRDDARHEYQYLLTSSTSNREIEPPTCSTRFVKLSKRNSWHLSSEILRKSSPMCKVTRDCKTEYPSSKTAMETQSLILLHKLS